MSMRRSRLILAVASLLALGGLIAGAATAAQGDPLDPRTYAPQSGPVLAVYAAGVQKYRCQANGTWLFTDPEATLYDSRRTRRPIGTHFLNGATGRPVWRYRDGSTVEAARTASLPGDPGASRGCSCRRWRRPATTAAWEDDVGATPGDLRRHRPRRSVHTRRDGRRALSADYVFWRAAGA